MHPRLDVSSAVPLSAKRPGRSLSVNVNESQAKRRRRSSGVVEAGFSHPSRGAQGQPPETSGSPCEVATSALAASSDIVHPGASRDTLRSHTSVLHGYVPMLGESSGSNKGASAFGSLHHLAAGAEAEDQKAVDSPVATSSDASVDPTRRGAASGLREIQAPLTALTVENVYAAAGLPCHHDACSNLVRNLKSSNDRLVGLVRELDASRTEAARASSLEAKVTCEYILESISACRPFNTPRLGLEVRVEHSKRMFNARGEALIGTLLLWYCTWP